MNPGKRYLRNTVIGLYGLLALFVGMNRLYASVDADTPSWLRSSLSAGLTVVKRTPPPPSLKLADLARMRDFNRLSLVGDFSVEIVGAAQYKVTSSAGDVSKLHSWQSDGALRLVWEDSPGTTAPRVLRIETPALIRIDATRLRQLTMQGLQAKELSVFLRNVQAAALQQNAVAQWKLYSDVPLELQVDQATLAAGSLQTRGELAIRFRE